MNERERKMVIDYISDPRWELIKKHLDSYIAENFIVSSAKKDTEFDTIWYAAMNEGGKYHLLEFFKTIEE